MGTNQFAEMLKYYLMMNNKSQKDLVDDLGYDKSTVSSWCSGINICIFFLSRISLQIGFRLLF